MKKNRIKIKVNFNVKLRSMLLHVKSFTFNSNVNYAKIIMTE